MNDKNIVLFVNAVRPATFAAFDEYKNRTGKKLVPVVLVDTGIQESITVRNAQTQHAEKVTVVSADFDSPQSVRDAIRPFANKIFAVTAQYENSIHELKKLVPYFPYLAMPTQSSLEWATEKKLMREMLEAHDQALVPKYLQVTDASSETISEIEASIDYPMIVKPSGLEGSLLVSLAHNHEELTAQLRSVFEQIQKGYDIWIKRQQPAVLVEEFMAGDMYTLDIYVGEDGKCYPTPPVLVITGRGVGYEDFFGYMQLTPSGLNEQETAGIRGSAVKAVQALNLRSKTAHVELMRTKTGWKIIELGPRIGGYRHELYMMAYGINHIVNDILIRAGEEPFVPTEVKGNAALFKIYAKSEGKLKSIEGEDAVRSLSSFVNIKQSLYEGDELKFAKNNGDPIFEIILFNPDREALAADIQKMEESLIINVD